MIIELYGLPRSGKTTLAKKIVKKTDFKIIKIRERRELLFYNFLFLIKHPVKFLKLLFFVISNSLSKPRVFYYKLMNCFFDYNAKYQKALRHKNAILDQGYFQNIISLFDKKIDSAIFKKYLKLILLPDKLFVLDVPSEELKKRIKKGAKLARSKFGQEYLKKWLEVIKKNDHFFKSNIDDLNINFLVVNSGRGEKTAIQKILRAIEK
jgi:thymidylate kinase